MKNALIPEYYFSEKPEIELRIKWGLLALSAALLAVIIAFWNTLQTEAAVKTFFVASENPVVEYLFRGITFIGDNEGFALVIALILWCVNKYFGFGTFMVLLFAGIYIFLLKEITGVPRPDIPGVTPPESLAFPSGHTLGVLAVWGFLAMHVKRRWFWGLAIAIILLVGISRMVIGVHYPGDVLGGISLGIIFFFIFFGALRWLSKREFKMPFATMIIIQLIGFGILFILGTIIFNSYDPPMALGLLGGLVIGFTLEKEKIRFNPTGDTGQHVLKYVIGMIVLLAIHRGLQIVAPVTADPETAWVLIRYFLCGIWLTYLAPLLFVRTGLASREVDEDLETSKQMQSG